MICMAAAGRKKGLSERIGKIFAEIINIFTGSFWTECPEVTNYKQSSVFLEFYGL